MPPPQLFGIIKLILEVPQLRSNRHVILLGNKMGSRRTRPFPIDLLHFVRKEVKALLSLRGLLGLERLNSRPHSVVLKVTQSAVPSKPSLMQLLPTRLSRYSTAVRLTLILEERS